MHCMILPSQIRCVHGHAMMTEAAAATTTYILVLKFYPLFLFDMFNNSDQSTHDSHRNIHRNLWLHFFLSIYLCFSKP